MAAQQFHQISEKWNVSSSDDEEETEGVESTTPPSSHTSRERYPSSPRRLGTGGGRRRRTIYTAGRPPWYNHEGQMVDAFVIGLAGGSASGKTTVSCRLIEALHMDWVCVLSMDSFYKVLDKEQSEMAARCEYNFDHPDAFDFDLMVSTLEKLKAGRRVEVPVYDFTTHSRAKYSRTLYGANVIVCEGILTFVHPKLRELMDLKVFVDTDSDIRLARRLKRDITERGRELSGVLKQYNDFVKPAFQQYIEPSMQFADIVIPRGVENTVAMQLIAQHITDQLQQRGFNIRSKLMMIDQSNGQMTKPDSVHLLPDNSRIKGLHTIIRNHKTSRDDFVFFSDRLSCLVIEHALSLLPFTDVQVKCPQKQSYLGKKFTGKLCGVSILRAGEVLEPALMSVCKDVTIGKILIQTNEATGEPELHFLRLPRDISKCFVVLMDATVATGAAAIMAIRVLLDHDVPQDHILFVSVIAAHLGLHSVAYVFPDVKMVTSAIDPRVNDHFHILPGVGNYGDRYFGTGLD